MTQKKIILPGLIVCAIIFLMTIQPVAAATTTLSITQKTVLENGVIFHQGVKPLSPIFYTAVSEMTSSELGDCYHIIGTIQILIEDSYTRDANFYSYWKTKITILPSDHAEFQIKYFMYERTLSGDINTQYAISIEHSISIDVLVKDQLETNVSMGVSQFQSTCQSITDKGYRVDQKNQIQTIEIFYTFDAILFDRSGIVPATTRTTTTTRPTMNTTTNATSSSSSDDSSSIPDTNSIDGYSIPLIMGGIFVALILMRKRLTQVIPPND